MDRFGGGDSHFVAMEKRIAQIVRIAEQRSGLVLLDDLKSLHVSSSALNRLVNNGVLRRVHRGTVFALGDAHLNFEAEIAAACFAVPESWASGTSAAQYWSMRRIPKGRLEISVNNARNPSLHGVRVRRINLPDPEIVTSIHGWNVSSPRQTLFDIALEVDDRTLLSAYEDCLNRELLTVTSVREFGSRAVKMGRHGSARFRRVILGRADDLPIAMSHPELELAKALESRDRRWTRQYPLIIHGGSTIHLDVARPDIKLGVEVDGELHDTPIAIHNDKSRDMQAALLGWQILRPTTANIDKRLPEVVSIIVRTAEQRFAQLHLP